MIKRSVNYLLGIINSSFQEINRGQKTVNLVLNIKNSPEFFRGRFNYYLFYRYLFNEY